jgi:hypothetical protein
MQNVRVYKVSECLEIVKSLVNLINFYCRNTDKLVHWIGPQGVDCLKRKIGIVQPIYKVNECERGGLGLNVIKPGEIH